MQKLYLKVIALCFVCFCADKPLYGQAIFNDTLAKQLEQIYSDDQLYRGQDDFVLSKFGWQSKEYAALQDGMRKQDSINQVKVGAILEKYGWLGEPEVGEDGASGLWYVIQHADYQMQSKYLPMMKVALKEKKLKGGRFALLEDRMALREGRKQIYGSQVSSNAKTGEQFVAPIENPESVDQRRAEMELPPLAQYLDMFGIKWSLEQYKRDESVIEEKTWHLPPYHQDSSVPVGMILFDERYDNPAFKTTDTLRLYAFRKPIFNGGKPAIINYFKEHYKSSGDKNANGYVTIKFFVNNDGKAGKFRIQTMDFGYQPAVLPGNVATHLFCLTREMRGWKPIEYQGNGYGYYCYLNFKIIKGEISEITP